MNTNSPNDDSQNIVPQRIAQLLTRATRELDDNTASALRRTRNAALGRQSQGNPVVTLGAVHGLRWLIPHSAHQWLAMVIILASIIFGGVSYWQHAHENDLAHIDVAILTDDLPLEVFVD